MTQLETQALGIIRRVREHLNSEGGDLEGKVIFVTGLMDGFLEMVEETGEEMYDHAEPIEDPEDDTGHGFDADDIPF